jgi:cyclophilin family peptidyl-prolyl cis-trans isomerase
MFSFVVLSLTTEIEMNSPMKLHLSTLLLVAIILLGSSCSTLKQHHLRNRQVIIQTTEGDITLRLHNETPLHRDNFIKLVKARFYDGLLFHRVIEEFMIQGGDPNSRSAAPDALLGDGDVGYSIPAEFRTPGIYHKYGSLAAAREGDDVNPQKASSGCQFYIVVGKKFTAEELDRLEERRRAPFSAEARQDYMTVGGTPHLDGNYTVFGEVVKGMDVVEKISKTETNEDDRPRKAIRTNRAGCNGVERMPTNGLAPAHCRSIFLTARVYYKS